MLKHLLRVVPFLAVVCLCFHVRAESPTTIGTAIFEPAADETEIAEPFRLERAEFEYRMTPVATSATQIAIYEVTFPSPVVTDLPANNTVHCEWFVPAEELRIAPARRDALSTKVEVGEALDSANRKSKIESRKSVPPPPHPSPLPRRARDRPEGEGARVPAVIVLHILGGDFDLSRLFCRTLAHNGVAALFVKMPYYGPRRGDAAERRMVSIDPRQTVEGMSQAIKDIRRARAWMAARPEVDPERTGVFGISLGGITSALAFTAEPRFHSACLMLAGGDIGQVGWQSPELREVRRHWEDQGGTEQEFLGLWELIDPVTYADRVKGRRVLMLNAAYDEVIPRSCTESLWRSFGEPEIVWFDAGHYSVARFMFDGLARVTRFFQAP